jgi:hypothetical protein
MYKFIAYERTESGQVTRKHNRVNLSAEDIITRYNHPEKLLGWPEKKVYWSKNEGECVGFAPMTVAAEKAINE